ncbi:MAG TPA: hypothetical protein PLN21_21155 [Gemmatales bacterium]|nr:hypothetical protein [Gemmatales bacterium]
MLKKLIFLLAVLLAAPLSANAQGNIPDGNYRLALITNPSSEQTMALIKIETKDGKQTGTLLAAPPRSQMALKEFKSNGKEVVIGLSNGLTFTSANAGADKSVLGSFVADSFAYRGKLTPTDKEELAANDMMVRVTVPQAFSQAMTLSNKPMQLRFQVQQEKDADKKKELQEKMAEAQKEADEKVAGLYKEVIEKDSDSPVALDAANNLLGMASKAKVDIAEAGKLVKMIEAKARPFGPGYVRFAVMQAANTLLRQKGLESVALDVLEPIYKDLSEKTPASQQQPILASYVQALKAGNRTSELKTVEARLEKVEGELDREYLATVPPFKPAKYSGRKESEANQVAVLELFTGAQCPPCVAADVAFDALEKAYSHKDLVLIQYHMHIPGPDPLTNRDTEARFKYYQKHFAGEIRGTPSTLFNGKSAAGGGGGMANSEVKFKEYSNLINPILEKTTPIKVNGTASRSGDKIDINVDVYGAEGNDDLKLRLIVVEESIKYVGGNKLRFHHQVVRAMPGGAEGIAIKDKNFKHHETADVSKIRAELTKYLDDYAANRPFPNTNRPLDMKNLKVIAIVQNDKNAEILQAIQLDVDGKVAAK